MSETNPKDGKFMLGESTAPPQLCPHCANTIAADAEKCPYCNTDISSEFAAPTWLKRSEPNSDPGSGFDRLKKRFSVPSSKYIWSAAALVAIVGAFVAGFYLQRRELALLLQTNQQQLQAKNVIIEGQQAQLAQVQQQLSASANQLEALKSKLEESQKTLSATQQRLTVASREASRSNAPRSAAARTTVARAPAPTPLPTRQVSTTRTAASGVYETTQATTVYESPSSGGRVISQIGRGTRINVVGSSGDWLEVRSNRGNPPGFVRADAARQIVRAN
jgi:cytoskeletal protein RodZ